MMNPGWASIRMYGLTFALVLCFSQYGWTPLHWASRNGTAGVVTILLQAGALVDIRDQVGELIRLFIQCIRVGAINAFGNA